MSEDGTPPNKKKRQPKKKWNEREIMLIIDYLQEEEDFEAPTAQFFYKKFIEKSKIDASWDLVRWKVRHLKSQFKKANDWLASTGAGVLEDQADGVTIEAKLLKVCPYYNRLKEIFGMRGGKGFEPIVLMSDTCSRASTVNELPLSVPASPSGAMIFEIDSQSTTPFAEAAPIAPVSIEQTSRASRVTPQKSAIGQLASIQKERVQLEKEKMQFQQQNFNKEKEIEERKLLIEEKKLDLEVRKHECEDKRRQEEIDLKRLELEMRERIAKYEIDMKYK